MLVRILTASLIAMLLISAALLILAYGLPASERNNADMVAPQIGSFAPSISGRFPDEQPITISFPSGRQTILNFWATWCVPCDAEMRELTAFARRNPDTDVIGVNSGEPAELVRTWLEERAVTFPSLIDYDGATYRAYQIIGQPTTVIVAANGIITHIFYGAITESTLTEALQSRKDG
jgi:thiol-disulfide isomerase/thioredoxin